MTLAEFKAWFEGFTEDLEGAPNEKQFAKIKERVAQIDGTNISPTVVREYIYPYWASRPFYPHAVYGGPTTTALLSSNAATTNGSKGESGNFLAVSGNTANWVSVDEMKALGAYDSMMV